MPNVGVVGAGIAGLHLGVLLRRAGVPTTIYADRSADELSRSRLLNTVMHHHLTLAREARLGIDHWDSAENGWRNRYLGLGAPIEVEYTSHAPGPSLAIDYRLYLPALMADFENAGGKLVVRPVQLDDLDVVARRHDLLVVASGRGGMSRIFPVRADVGPPPGVRRHVCAVLVNGIERPSAEGVTLSCVPGVGELIEIPMLTAQGQVTALLFEAIPGGPAAGALSVGDPGYPVADIDAKITGLLRDFFPATYQRVKPGEFASLGPDHVFRGALGSVMRAGSTYLADGRLTVALGDAHVVVDPVMGQGANIASASAEVLGNAILQDRVFDDHFARDLAHKRDPLLRAAYDWTNLQLAAPKRLLRLHQAAAANPFLAQDLAGRYSRPQDMWRVLATADRTSHYIEGFAAADSSAPERIAL